MTDSKIILSEDSDFVEIRSEYIDDMEIIYLANEFAAQIGSEDSQAKKSKKGNQELDLVDLPRNYSCVNCHAHLTDDSQILSKEFTGGFGRAFLLHSVENIELEGEEKRTMLSGLHTVANVICKSCRTEIGWKYIIAHDPEQKYKEGKFIVNVVHLEKAEGWSAEEKLNFSNAEEIVAGLISNAGDRPEMLQQAMMLLKQMGKTKANVY